MSDAHVRLAHFTPALQFSNPRCPTVDCAGIMVLDRIMKCLEGTGLEALSCRACGHRGFRSTGGILTLFGGRHEHVCSYGPSMLTLTIVFSGAALTFVPRSWVISSSIRHLCCLLGFVVRTGGRNCTPISRVSFPITML